MAGARRLFHYPILNTEWQLISLLLWLSLPMGAAKLRLTRGQAVVTPRYASATPRYVSATPNYDGPRYATQYSR